MAASINNSNNLLCNVNPVGTPSVFPWELRILRHRSHQKMRLDHLRPKVQGFLGFRRR